MTLLDKHQVLIDNAVIVAFANLRSQRRYLKEKA